MTEHSTEEARLLAVVRSAERAAAQWGKNNEDAQYVSEVLARVAEFLTSEAEQVTEAKADALDAILSHASEFYTPSLRVEAVHVDAIRAVLAPRIRPGERR